MQESCAILPPLLERRCKDMPKAWWGLAGSKVVVVMVVVVVVVNTTHVRNLSPMVVQLFEHIFLGLLFTLSYHL